MLSIQATIYFYFNKLFIKNKKYYIINIKYN